MATTFAQEEQLHQLLNETDDMGKRREILAAIKQISQAATAKWEQEHHGVGAEDAVANKHRQAQDEKARKLKEIDDLGRTQKEAQCQKESVREAAIQARYTAAKEQRVKDIEHLKEVGRAMQEIYHAGSDRAAKDTVRVADEVKARKMENLYAAHAESAKANAAKPSSSGVPFIFAQKAPKKESDVTKTGGCGGTEYVLHGKTPAGARIATSAAASKPKLSRRAKAK